MPRHRFFRIGVLAAMAVAATISAKADIITVLSDGGTSASLFGTRNITSGIPPVADPVSIVNMTLGRGAGSNSLAMVYDPVNISRGQRILLLLNNLTGASLTRLKLTLAQSSGPAGFESGGASVGLYSAGGNTYMALQELGDGITLNGTELDILLKHPLAAGDEIAIYLWMDVAPGAPGTIAFEQFVELEGGFPELTPDIPSTTPEPWQISPLTALGIAALGWAHRRMQRT